ncbi:IQ domain-containing protein C [Pristis pectinata]|uniref:IQ domain-containing protein C n=1 Tax=Pristis pectinata TaxID=685728 RepID=UPI00223E2080|nr:IQ domain-containing protein C [Pristis pectinata]
MAAAEKLGQVCVLQLSGTEGVYNVPKSKTSEALCPEAEKSADCSLFENDEPVKDSCESRNSSSRQSIPKQLEVPNTLNTDTSSHGQAPQIEGVTPFLETEEASCARGDERRDPDNSTSVMSACISTVLENISNASIASEMQDTPNEPLCKLQRKEMPTTCQELQNYRSSLAMELLWLQQAIASRKNDILSFSNKMWCFKVNITNWGSGCEDEFNTDFVVKGNLICAPGFL